MISYIERLIFTRELAVLLKSGISLGEALESLQEKAGRKETRHVIGTLLSDVQNGQPLSSGLARFPKIFTSLAVNLVRIGEASGTLQKNMEFLAEQQERAYALRKKIQGIVLYPMIVLSMALLLSAFISVFILPKLIRLFDSFQVTLPWTTRVLLAISHFMQNYGLEFFISLFLGVGLLRIMVALAAVRPYWHMFLFRLPITGELSRNIATAHFCRDVGTMLQSGLPVLEALQIEVSVIENQAFSRRVAMLAQAVAEGRTLSDELHKKSHDIFPLIAIKMIASGEKTGRLDETLLYLERFFETEVDRKIKNMAVLFEPILLLVIGSLVVFLALAILTPIYSLTGSIRR